MHPNFYTSCTPLKCALYPSTTTLPPTLHLQCFCTWTFTHASMCNLNPITLYILYFNELHCTAKVHWVWATHCAIFQHCWFLCHNKLNYEGFMSYYSNATAFAMMRLVLNEDDGDNWCQWWRRLICWILRIHSVAQIHRFAANHFIPLLKLLRKLEKPFPKLWSRLTFWNWKARWWTCQDVPALNSNQGSM